MGDSSGYDEDATHQAEARLVKVLTPEKDVRESYKEWAENYEKDVGNMNYVHPEIVAKGLASGLGDKKKSKILDVCAGTGLVGQHLNNLGFYNIDALDATQEMLDIAKSKSIYNNYYCVLVTDKPISQIEDNSYDALISTGSFCENHLKPDCLPEFIRLVKPGGLVMVAITEMFMATVESLVDFEPTIEALCEQNKWKLLERKRHLLFINNNPGVTFLLQVL